jgi:hypothetical protein
MLTCIMQSNTNNHFIFLQDNAKNGLLQMDDRLLLYNGGDHQESSTTIDPDSISWSHISVCKRSQRTGGYMI